MHNIHHQTYELNVNKAKVQEYWDDVVRHEDYGEGASGLPNSIRWTNYVFESKDEAMQYIEREDERHWYNCMAVQFKQYPMAKDTKAIEDLRRRRAEAGDRLTRTLESAKIQHRTSEKIGCPKCGSSLALKYLRGQNCPLCGEDLRSPTNLDRIAKAKENISNLNKLIREAEEKESRKLKPKICWLVKVEYHT